MRAIEVTVTVSIDGAIELSGVANLPPGKHHALLVVEEPLHGGRELLTWKTYPVGLASDAETFRREDLYGDNGR